MGGFREPVPMGFIACAKDFYVCWYILRCLQSPLGTYCRKAPRYEFISPPDGADLAVPTLLLASLYVLE